VLWIEQDDFRETPPPKYFRLSPGVEVRLRAAYVVKCTGLTKDSATGAVTEVRCTYDPETRGGEVKGRKIKSTIHWVSAAHAAEAEIRLYDTLFTVPKPDEAPDFKSVINAQSLEIVRGAKVEPALAEAQPEDHVQFERVGYFVADWKDHRPGHPVFNRSVGLRDTWARIEKASS
jgi:glutaminyl-tRNA synthetase